MITALDLEVVQAPLMSRFGMHRYSVMWFVILGPCKHVRVT